MDESIQTDLKMSFPDCGFTAKHSDATKSIPAIITSSQRFVLWFDARFQMTVDTKKRFRAGKCPRDGIVMGTAFSTSQKLR